MLKKEEYSGNWQPRKDDFTDLVGSSK